MFMMLLCGWVGGWVGVSYIYYVLSIKKMYSCVVWFI